jgi:hypothetical protein
LPKPSDLPFDDEPTEIADAGHLTGGPPPASSRPPAASRAPSGLDSGGYDLIDEETTEVDPDPRPPVPPPIAKPRPVVERRPAGELLDDDVHEVWTRWGEWKSNLVPLGSAALVLLFLLFVTFDVDQMGRTFLLLVIGGAVLIGLAYPIFITLERPVRITPEQAAQDYYAALSHFLPHYRRMWLLLSSRGRSSPSFSTFDEFKEYWKLRLTLLRDKAGGRFMPLDFRVEEFKGEKSAGMTETDARFSVKVFRAGREGEGPIASYRLESGFVKGPDKMWYLGLGTLPEGDG